MKRENETLFNYFLRNARGGNTVADVFDIMYELNLSYEWLSPALEWLKEEGEIEEIDRRTYRFIGDLAEREWERPKETPKEKKKESVAEGTPEKDDDGDDDLSETLASRNYRRLEEYLEKKRKEREEQEAREAREERRRRALFDDSENKPFADSPEDSADTSLGDLFEGFVRTPQDGEDELYKKALRHSVLRGVTSVSQIQRALGVGYSLASRLLYRMEKDGYVMPQIGLRARKVTLTMEEYLKLYEE